MDKGFNDDELADIMNEIESLEKEFTADAESPQDPTSEAPVSEAEAEEMMMAQMESEEESLEAPTADPTAEVSQTEEESFDAPVSEVEEELEVSSEQQQIEESVEPKEITAAQEEMTSEGADEQTNVVAFSAPTSKEETEVLEDLTSMEVEEVTPHHTKEDNTNVHNLEATKTVSSATPFTGGGHHTSMNFSVEGDMKLNLNFNISGKVVSLHIAEDHFSIELDGGMSFNIPFDHAQENKKAA